MPQSLRNTQIDTMKGFAILLVLLGHRFMTNTVEGVQHPMTIIIYSFHMAFFFFISGYVNEYTGQFSKKSSYTYLLDKLRTILMPFFVWSLICYITDGGSSIENFFTRLNFYPERGYWFLPIIFAFFTISLIFNRLNIKSGGVIFIILLLIVMGLYFKHVYPIWYASYFLAFVLGEYMAKKNYAEYLTRKSIYGISTILLILCWCVYPLDATSIGKLINLCMMFLIAFTSCITIFNFFKVAKLPCFVEKYFCEIGKYTLVLYLVPILILPPRTYTVDSQLTFTTVNLVIIAVAVLHSIISYVIGRIVYEIPYLRFILFGKK